tara:strand:- start:2949 stop:3614 length:666 start_codon:yes stop_codon:yes gene_type:complete
MIVDLNLRGKRVAVFGAGRESGRKVDGLLVQDCQISVFAEEACEDIRRWAQEGKLKWIKGRIVDDSYIEKLNDFTLVIAATNDRYLNRCLSECARKNGSYAYCVDDPDNSDFSHPAIVNLNNMVNIAISTGGRSPLMARNLREKLEPILKETISHVDFLRIQLQEKLRSEAQIQLPDSDLRRRFLINIAENYLILNLLENDRFDEAEKVAMELLRGFVSIS